MSLQVLSGQGNYFRTGWLPDPVSGATLIRVLDVSFCHGIILPHHLQNFPGLQQLKLRCCGLTSIPVGLLPTLFLKVCLGHELPLYLDVKRRDRQCVFLLLSVTP
jgi:hypothetical protein